MKKYSIFFLFLFLLFLSGSSFSQTPVKSKKIVIYAEGGWQDSGVELKQGQYYAIKASGHWSSGYPGLVSGPEGFGHGTLTDHALLGWVSITKPEKLGYKSFTNMIIKNIVLLGKEGMFIAQDEGNLWLTMGEWSGCKECNGKVEVLIMIYE